MVVKTGSLAKGVTLALFLAGPIFLLMLGLAQLCQLFPRAIEMPELGESFAALLLLPVAAIVGAIISSPANLIGGTAMGVLGEHHGWARPPIVWTLAGTALGIAITLAVTADNPQVAFALIATSAICARICRLWVRWVDGEDFVSPWARTY